MRLLVGHDDAVANWVGFRIGAPIHQPYTALGWIDQIGKLSVGFVFYGFVPEGNIDIALAASGRLLPGILRTVADYVFHQCHASRMTARIKRSNRSAYEQLERAGFVKESICRAYFGSDDAVQFRMLAKDCRWLRKQT